MLSTLDKLRKKGLKRSFISVLSHAYKVPLIRRGVVSFATFKEPKKWIFLVGCYNSGTSITYRILSKHPDVSGLVLPQEGVHYTNHLPKPDDLGWDRMWIKCKSYMNIDINDSNRADAVKKDWAPLLDKRKPAFLEKSITNVSRMEWLDKHFPNAHFVGMTRNGYCVAEGLVRRATTICEPATLEHQGAYPIEWAAEQWVEANEMLLKSKNSVGKYMGFKYEDFMSDPISILNDLWDYLDLRRPEMSYSNGNLIVDGHLFKIRNMNEESLQRLGESQKSKIDVVASEMFSKLGY